MPSRSVAEAGSSSSRLPAASMSSTAQPRRTAGAATTSRVVPGTGATRLLAWPTRAFMRLLFPALTRPASTTRHGTASRRPTRAAASSRPASGWATATSPRATIPESSEMAASSDPDACRQRIMAALGPQTPGRISRASWPHEASSSQSCHAACVAPASARLASTAAGAAVPPWLWISRRSTE